MNTVTARGDEGDLSEGATSTDVEENDSKLLKRRLSREQLIKIQSNEWDIAVKDEKSIKR